MTSDKFDKLGPAFAEIGREAVRLGGGEPDGILLYVEIGDGWVEPSLFKDDGASVRYVDLGTSIKLDDLIMDAWCLEPADKRWTAMQYTIDHGKFAAEFRFDELEGLEDNTGDRRERILRARYGDKPVVYPPLPSHAWTLKTPS